MSNYIYKMTLESQNGNANIDLDVYLTRESIEFLQHHAEEQGQKGIHTLLADPDWLLDKFDACLAETGQALSNEMLNTVSRWNLLEGILEGPTNEEIDDWGNPSPVVLVDGYWTAR